MVARSTCCRAKAARPTRFPKYFPLGDVRLALHYRFEPGATDDGVTLDVPLHLLKALDPARLSWLVPGFVEDKATGADPRPAEGAAAQLRAGAGFRARVRARRTRKPTADALDGRARALPAHAPPARRCRRSISTPAALPPHLRMNLRLLDRRRRRQRAGDSRDLARCAALRRARRDGLRRARRRAPGARRACCVSRRRRSRRMVPGAAGVPAYPGAGGRGRAASALRVFAEPRRGARRARARRARAAADRAGRQGAAGAPAVAGVAQAGLAVRGDRIRGAARARPSSDAARRPRRRRSTRCADGLDDDPRPRRLRRARREAVAAQLFAEAMRGCSWPKRSWRAVAERARRSSNRKLMGWASGNLDDMRAHLAALVQPGFLRDDAGRSCWPSSRATCKALVAARRARAARSAEGPGADAGAPALRRRAARPRARPRRRARRGRHSARTWRNCACRCSRRNWARAGRCRTSGWRQRAGALSWIRRSSGCCAGCPAPCARRWLT